MNKQKVPQLRFPGFDGEWGNYSLKKIIVDLNSGISVNSDDFPIQNDLEVGILKTSCVANGIFKESENKKIVENEVSRAKLNPTKNEIIISRMNTPQLVGESGYIDRDYPSLFIPDRLWQTVVNQELCNSRWLSYFLITEKVRDNLKSIATGTSGTMKNISKPNFLSINVLIPTLTEQQKIASFLSVVDEKIQQLSRKKELLEQYKKGVMQQLFSGKLRFKDENGKDYPDWEEKSFGTVTKFINGKAYKQVELLSEGKYRVLRVGNLFSNNEWYYSDLELDKDKYIEKGDLIYAWSASFGPRFWNEEKIIYHYHIWKVVPNYNVDKQFLFHAFMFDVEKLKLQSQGGTMFHITKGNIESRLFNFPSVPEQQKIANFLSSIDAKIENTNSELEKTQGFKKGLLQKMFV
jgi:type I restriction enzyme, S subunit